jgi:hypothetical protein
MRTPPLTAKPAKPKPIIGLPFPIPTLPPGKALVLRVANFTEPPSLSLPVNTTKSRGNVSDAAIAPSNVTDAGAKPDDNAAMSAKRRNESDSGEASPKRSSRSSYHLRGSDPVTNERQSSEEEDGEDDGDASHSHHRHRHQHRDGDEESSLRKRHDDDEDEDEEESPHRRHKKADEDKNESREKAPRRTPPSETDEGAMRPPLTASLPPTTPSPILPPIIPGATFESGNETSPSPPLIQDGPESGTPPPVQGGAQPEMPPNEDGAQPDIDGGPEPEMTPNPTEGRPEPEMPSPEAEAPPPDSPMSPDNDTDGGTAPESPKPGTEIDWRFSGRWLSDFRGNRLGHHRWLHFRH